MVHAAESVPSRMESFARRLDLKCVRDTSLTGLSQIRAPEWANRSNLDRKWIVGIDNECSGVIYVRSAIDARRREACSPEVAPVEGDHG